MKQRNEPGAVVAAGAVADTLQLTGAVSDGKSPIAMATVCAQGSSRSNRLDRRCTTADVEGIYRLALLQGQYSVTASAAEHESVTLLARLNGQSITLDFALPSRAPTLAGSVRSASGERIAGARVTVYRNELPVANVVTDDAGAFAVWSPAGALVVNAEAPEFGSASVHTIAPTLDVAVTLFPANVVTGRVLMQGSLQPVPHVRVTAVGRPDRIAEPIRDAETFADEHGRFAFTELAAGSWTLSVRDQFLWGTLASPIAVTLGQKLDDLTMLVDSAGAVSGRLSIKPTDVGCRVGRVQFIPQASGAQHAFTAEIESDGTVYVAALPVGAYRIGPYCDEHQFSDGALTTTISERQTAEFHWTFVEGLGITAHVVDETGKPTQGAMVNLSPTDQSLTRGMVVRLQRSGVTDEQGQYRFGGLLPGRYRATARHAGINGKEIVSTDIVLSRSGAPHPLILTLPGTGTIRIHATSLGKPISRMLFFALDAAGARYEATYKGDGQFSIGPLTPGGYRVFAYDNKNAKLPLNGGAPVAIVDATPVEIDFHHSPPDAVLEGRVVDHRGAPVSGTLIRAINTTLDESDEFYSTLQSQLHGPQELMTDHMGRFRIDGLNARTTYDLYVDHSSGLKDVRRQVTPGHFVEVALSQGATIVGDVVDAGGEPVVGFDVVVSNIETGTNRSRSYSSAQGRFVLDNLTSGRVQISVYDHSDELSADRFAQIESGQTLNIGRIVLGPTSTAQLQSKDEP